MNYDDRLYLIGGAPRVGKSLLAERLSKKINAHIVATDSIRHAARKVVTDPNSDLLLLTKENDLSEQEWVSMHVDTPQVPVDHQNRESIAAWPAIKGFMETFQDDTYLHIVEGVALLPSLVSKLSISKNHVVYLGNTNPAHDETMQAYATANPELDWLSALNYSSQRIKALAVFIQGMSRYFQREAERYGFAFVDLHGQDFNKALDGIASQLAGN